MDSISISAARKNLYQLVNQAAESHEPTIIKGRKNSAVLISQEDWEDIQETMWVLQNKKLSRSLQKNMKEDYKDCSTKLDW